MNAEDAQVLSGLTLQDMVITSGGYGLDENTRVKIGVDPNAKPDDDDAKPSAATPAGADAKPGKDADDK